MERIEHDLIELRGKVEKADKTIYRMQLGLVLFMLLEVGAMMQGRGIVVMLLGE